MPIPGGIPMPDVFSITPTINARMAGLQSRYQREDRDQAAEQRMTDAIARMAYSANTPEQWTQMLGALQRRFPQADLSSFQDFSSREMAIGQGLSLEGQINRDFNERGWAQGQEDRATAASQRNALTQGLRTAADGQPVPTVDPNNPSWMVRGSGATGTNAPPVIDYANQGATRNDPITGELQNALQAAAESVGIDRIVVHSGGQEAEGEGGERTGSTRHDHGNAADVDLYVGGRRLDYNNPQDQALFAQFVTAAANNGVTGIGAGEGYMGGNGRIHVGFGAPAVWGAGGAGENAPEWLRTAYNAASRERTGGAPFSAQERVVFDALLDGGQIDQAFTMLTQAMAPPEPRDPINMAPGNTLYDPNTRQPLFTAPETPGGAEPPDTDVFLGPDGQPHRMAWNPQTGRYDIDMGIAASTADGVDVILPGQADFGQVPAGYARIADPNSATGFKLVPEPGGEAEGEIRRYEDGVAQETITSIARSTIVLDDIDRAISLVESNPLLAGWSGQRLLDLGFTAAVDVRSLLSTINSTIGIDRLLELKAASPTGASGFGALTAPELQLLLAQLGSLDQAQSGTQLIRNLQRVRQLYGNVLTGLNTEAARLGIDPATIPAVGGAAPPNIRSGNAPQTPNLAAPAMSAGPPAGPETWRTATNPTTGERLRLNPMTNQWEPL